MKTKLRDITTAACAACAAGILALYAGVAAAESEEEARRLAIEAVKRMAIEAEERTMQELYPPRAGESVVLNTVTGDYKITYYNERQKALTYATFVPSTKIDPTVNSKLHLDKKTWTVNYGYSISSGEKSRQLLKFFKLEPMGRVVGSRDLPTATSPEEHIRLLIEQGKAVSDANKRAVIAPAGWEGLTANHETGISTVTWYPANFLDSNAGLAPKGRLKGLGFASLSLPGVGVARFTGTSGELGGLPSVGPRSEIKQQLEKLRRNDFVPRNAAVPTIAVPTPFDPALLLERTQTHVHTWIAMKLLDPAFSTQLDSFFQAAINAYRLNQTEAAQKHLQAMRRHLKQEHADADKEDHGDDRDDDKDDDKEKNKTKKRVLIDKLAARILDFDLKYVLKRMGGDD